MNHAAFNSRANVITDGEPAVSGGVAHIVFAGLIAGILGVAFGAVAGFGFWGLVLCYVLVGNLGVASVIATKAFAA